MLVIFYNVVSNSSKKLHFSSDDAPTLTALSRRKVLRPSCFSIHLDDFLHTSNFERLEARVKMVQLSSNVEFSLLTSCALNRRDHSGTIFSILKNDCFYGLKLCLSRISIQNTC